MHRLYRFTLPILYCLLAGLTACSPSHQERWRYVKAYHQGSFPKSEARLNRMIEKKMPQQHFQACQQAVWLFLDRATIRFAAGDTKGALADYQLAVEAQDFFSQTSPSEVVGRLALSDEASAYTAPPFENQLLRFYFSLCCLHQNDENNARALLRNEEELFQANPYPQLECNPLARYLFSRLLDRHGDHSNASLLMNQAHELLTEPLDPGANLLILIHQGKVPYRTSSTCPASEIALMDLEGLVDQLGGTPAISSSLGVPIPQLREWPDHEPPLLIGLDKQSLSSRTLYSIRRAAHRELGATRDKLAARSLARLLLRRGLVAAADKTDEGLGAAVDLAMLVLNANTYADTRSWSTLPACLDLATARVSQGFHHLQVGATEYPFFLDKQDLCIIHIFHPEPEVAIVRIPDRFLKPQGVK